MAWQLAKAMRKKRISKARMAVLLKTSRSQVDRILDPKRDITLSSLQRAAALVGQRVGMTGGASNPVTEGECGVAGERYNSPSFAEACKTAVIAKQRFAAAREQLMLLFQAYAFGQQVARDSRALPTDCQSAYDSMTNPDSAIKGDAVAAIGFKNGCLEVAKKQAKRILKEDDKRAKEAARQAKKQAQAGAHD